MVVVWKFFTMARGAQSVTTTGDPKKQLELVASWVVAVVVGFFILVVGAGLYGWIT
jgi:hypothetical protein